jgi:hypothetical protein
MAKITGFYIVALVGLWCVGVVQAAEEPWGGGAGGRQSRHRRELTCSEKALQYAEGAVAYLRDVGSRATTVFLDKAYIAYVHCYNELYYAALSLEQREIYNQEYLRLARSGLDPVSAKVMAQQNSLRAYNERVHEREVRMRERRGHEGHEGLRRRPSFDGRLSDEEWLNIIS